MSLYVSGREITAFHQKSYPKKRASRDVQARTASTPAPDPNELTYQQFIEGAVQYETKRLTA